MRLLPVLRADMHGEFGSRGRLTGALQADHHHNDRRLGLQIERNMAIVAILSAKHRNQFVIDDLDHLLAWSHRFQDALADGLLGYPVDEVARHRQRDIRLQQRDPHFAHRIAHILFAQGAPTAQAVERATKAIRKSVEHKRALIPQETIHPAWGQRNTKNAGERNLVGQRARQRCPDFFYKTILSYFGSGR